MFIVLLKFVGDPAGAVPLMEDHRAWIQRGFEDGVFVLVGSLKPARGGTIVAHATSLEDLQRRVSADPFVAENVVSAEILEIAPARTDARLAFLAA
jgi:uncharacterized protein YciI